MNSALYVGAVLCAALAIGCLLVSIARATKPKDEPKKTYYTSSLPDPLDSFAWSLRRARMERQITQKQLAERMGIPWRTISSVENLNNRHTFAFMCRIADALGVRVKIELEEK